MVLDTAFRGTRLAHPIKGGRNVWSVQVAFDCLHTISVLVQSVAVSYRCGCGSSGKRDPNCKFQAVKVKNRNYTQY